MLVGADGQGSIKSNFKLPVNNERGSFFRVKSLTKNLVFISVFLPSF